MKNVELRTRIPNFFAGDRVSYVSPKTGCSTFGRIEGLNSEAHTAEDSSYTFQIINMIHACTNPNDGALIEIVKEEEITMGWNKK